MVCDVGDEVELTAVFASRELTAREHATYLEEGTLPDGVTARDPDAPSATVLKPDGTTVTPDIEEYARMGEPLPGAKVARVTADMPGPWVYAFDGDDGVRASGERSFGVRKRRVPR